MTEAAKILRWIVLVVMAIVIALELTGNIANWAMGLLLVPLIFAFLYFWQASSKPSE